ncbi:MAG TPA: D-alanine--poly(phosphoribitol) ligase [Lachnospiraceae bacterium]|nr:D-alanine--poly(phosphoribitol) ligase [Lachnospiraceae bacterium]
MRNVLEYLEHTAAVCGSRTAVEDVKKSCTFRELRDRAKSIGSRLAEVTGPREPVAVYMDKGVDALTAFMGSVYAGCFYVFVNTELPAARIRDILEISGARVALTTGEWKEKLSEPGFTGRVFCLEEIEEERNEALLSAIRSQAVDIDPLYANFTSGSTGKPKGVVVSHRSVLDFIGVFPEMFGIGEQDVIGNQAPFDFDVSVKDIYTSLKTGARLVVIPKAYFSFPTQLLDYLCERKVTTLIWAVSALCMVTALKGFSYRVPELVDKVLFSGEKMPMKHLKAWRRHLPDASFVNLYGPTEITCNCTYYRIGPDFAGKELPIGRAFPNEKVFLLDEEDRLVTEPDRPGEICVAGTALALGYYGNPEETAKHFVQNPLNGVYRELIYRTGDLGRYDGDGLLYFVGRKDFQIKHMGHRIELEEIEAALYRVPGVEQNCCIFLENKNQIAACYVGTAAEKDIRQILADILPMYMIPGLYRCLEAMPLKNGKIDRSAIKALWEGRQE